MFRRRRQGDLACAVLVEMLGELGHIRCCRFRCIQLLSVESLAVKTPRQVSPGVSWFTIACRSSFFIPTTGMADLNTVARAWPLRRRKTTIREASRRHTPHTTVCGMPVREFGRGFPGDLGVLPSFYLASASRIAVFVKSLAGGPWPCSIAAPGHAPLGKTVCPAIFRSTFTYSFQSGILGGIAPFVY